MVKLQRTTVGNILLNHKWLINHPKWGWTKTTNQVLRIYPFCNVVYTCICGSCNSNSSEIQQHNKFVCSTFEHKHVCLYVYIYGFLTKLYCLPKQADLYGLLYRLVYPKFDPDAANDQPRCCDILVLRFDAQTHTPQEDEYAHTILNINVHLYTRIHMF